MELNPCDNGCSCANSCPYGVRFYECPVWCEWAARRNEAEENTDEY